MTFWHGVIFGVFGTISASSISVIAAAMMITWRDKRERRLLTKKFNEAD